MQERIKRNNKEVEHQRLRDFLFGDSERERGSGDFQVIDSRRAMKLANILVPSSLLAAFLLSLLIF